MHYLRLIILGAVCVRKTIACCFDCGSELIEKESGLFVCSNPGCGYLVYAGEQEVLCEGY